MTDPTPECALCLTEADTCATTEEIDGQTVTVHDFCVTYARRNDCLTIGGVNASIYGRDPDVPAASRSFQNFIQRIGDEAPGIGRVAYRLLASGPYAP